jgi:regulator of extracellular matrix RemA (YlzA/DUF370 family)
MHIGFGHTIDSSRIIGIATPLATPNDKIIDICNGRETQSLIFTDNGYTILSILAPDTILRREYATHADINTR